MAGWNAGAAVVLQNGFCSVTVVPASLQVSIQEIGKHAVPVSIAQTNLGPIAALASSSTNSSWSFPDKKISVALALDDNGLLAHIQADETGDFTFPIIPETDSTKTWILPLLEGVTEPNGGIGYEGFFSCSFYVNDPAAALPMVQQELQRMGLLPFAHIAQLDSETDCFRTFYLIGPKRPCEECFQQCAQYLLKALSPANAGSPPSLPPSRPRPPSAP